MKEAQEHAVELAVGDSELDFVKWSDRYLHHVLLAEGILVPEPKPTAIDERQSA